MNNWENNKVILNELGVLGGQVPNDVLTWLKKIISKDRHENMRYNKSLAGHIKDEFLIRCEYRNVGIVEKNDIVKQGDIIGTVGSSGRSTGPHLDVRLNWFGTRLDPATVLDIN